MKIFIKNILLGVGVIVTLLLTDYIQIYTEIYFENSLYRWGFGLIVSILVCYIVLFPIFRLLNVNSGQEGLGSLEESGSKTDELLEVDEIKKDEMNVLDVNESDYTSTSNSIFRLYHSKSYEPAYVDGWIVIDKNIQEKIGRDLVGYIPINSTNGSPIFISSYAVDRYEYLYEKQKPKYINNRNTLEEMTSVSEVKVELNKEQSENRYTEIFHSVDFLSHNEFDVIKDNNYHYPRVGIARTIIGGYGSEPYKLDEVAILSLMFLYVGNVIKVDKEKWTLLDDVESVLIHFSDVDSLESFAELFDSLDKSTYLELLEEWRSTRYYVLNKGTDLDTEGLENFSFGVRLDSVQMSTKTYLREQKLKAGELL